MLPQAGQAQRFVLRSAWCDRRFRFLLGDVRNAGTAMESNPVLGVSCRQKWRCHRSMRLRTVLLGADHVNEVRFQPAHNWPLRAPGAVEPYCLDSLSYSQYSQSLKRKSKRSVRSVMRPMTVSPKAAPNVTMSTKMPPRAVFPTMPLCSSEKKK